MVIHSEWALAKRFDAIRCHLRAGVLFVRERGRDSQGASIILNRCVFHISESWNRCRLIQLLTNPPVSTSWRQRSRGIACIELRWPGPLPINRRANVSAIPFRPRSHEMNIALIRIRRASHIILLALLWACLCSAAHAKRKDVVIMNNGYRFTGEVKRLENGLLYVETDYVASSIGLD
jgi:hypothetical protein